MRVEAFITFSSGISLLNSTNLLTFTPLYKVLNSPKTLQIVLFACDEEPKIKPDKVSVFSVSSLTSKSATPNLTKVLPLNTTSTTFTLPSIISLTLVPFASSLKNVLTTEAIAPTLWLISRFLFLSKNSFARTPP